MLRYKRADCGSDGLLKKTINDFNSLYLNAKVGFNPRVVACGAALIELIYEAIIDGSDLSAIGTSLKIAKMLEFENLEGKKRGSKIKEMKQVITEEFASFSCIDIKELNGKRPIRMFWAVVNKYNIEDIKVVMGRINGGDWKI